MVLFIFYSGVMEDETASMVVDDRTSETAENFEWNSPRQTIRERKHQRIEGTELPPKFKGVVPQPNGHSGAQIYATPEDLIRDVQIRV